MKMKMISFVLGIVMLEVLAINWLHLKIKVETIGNELQQKTEILLENKISNDIKCFPVPMKNRESVEYENDYGLNRENGTHEGCDILYSENMPGIVPIVSSTDGEISNLGWLYLGGYRVGITSTNGIYYYYAHLDSYAPGLVIGKKVNAGEFLGFMGNSGEGAEGTTGKFPVHLHFGIYVEAENGNEKSVNPYYYLLKINQE